MDIYWVNLKIKAKQWIFTTVRTACFKSSIRFASHMGVLRLGLMMPPRDKHRGGMGQMSGKTWWNLTGPTSPPFFFDCSTCSTYSSNGLPSSRHVLSCRDDINLQFSYPNLEGQIPTLQIPVDGRRFDCDLENHSYWHLLVITCYFYGIIHSINGVISTYTW